MFRLLLKLSLSSKNVSLRVLFRYVSMLSFYCCSIDSMNDIVLKLIVSALEIFCLGVFVYSLVDGFGGTVFLVVDDY